MRRLLTGVSLNDKVQNDKSSDIKKKRKFEERPLTGEQKRKREEFFLKEEEWERQVDLTRLSDKGKLNQKNQILNHYHGPYQILR